MALAEGLLIMTKLTKVHDILVRVRFDKSISRTAAVAAFRDNVHGEFYPTAYNDSDAETMNIKKVGSAANFRNWSIT